jgi:hypothetical protein
MVKRIYAFLGLLVILIGLWVAYELTVTQMTADVYRDRLEQLTGDYERLRGTYNEAVRRTAVTELLVKDGQLSVVVRNAEGVLRTIPTNFDPKSEIYVDYVVLDGRLWIRRVFDHKTPPENGLLIDPELKNVDFTKQAVAHGKAVYRTLGEGRWIITVTGDGSLGLAPAGDEPPRLAPPPVIQEFKPDDQPADPNPGHVGPLDMIKQKVK